MPDSPRPTGRVFGIGFHKTGTKSLAKALRLLGYHPVGGMAPVLVPYLERGDLEAARRLAAPYQALQDHPWPQLYRELDRWFPGSRFVLTVRDLDDWIASACNHFGTEDTPLHAFIYGHDAGHPVGHEDRWREVHARHVAEVRQWFADRPEALLELDITRGEGWERLAPFLGLPAPNRRFPHRNQRRPLQVRPVPDP